jgi:hypothetical protein
MIMSDKVKNILIYTGLFASIISGVSYLIVTYVLVTGFSTNLELQKQLLFAILGALTGLLITFFLRSQGVAFAKREEESKKTMALYFEALNRKKKVKQLHTITHFMIVSTIMDIIFKGISIAVATSFLLYIFMEGNGNFGLFGLAVANIFMFAGFGMMALSQAYDKYIDEHIPVIKALTEKLKQEQAGSIQSKENPNGNVQQCEISISSTASRKESPGHRNTSE